VFDEAKAGQRRGGEKQRAGGGLVASVLYAALFKYSFHIIEATVAGTIM
jgi:hypothetical protein